MSDRPKLRVLLFGSPTWTDKDTVYRAFTGELTRFKPMEKYGPAVLVNGDSEFQGASALADLVWAVWVRQFPTLFDPVERYYVRDFPNRRARDLHMINCGADVCIVLAEHWFSDAGQCARLARKAKLNVVDYGVPTGIEDQPGRVA
jgi:hypothetical protein